MTGEYRVRRTPLTETRRLRGLDYHLTRWEGREPGVTPVVLLHGYLDCGATFQFLADASSGEATLLAPDWRGFGGTAWATGDYWFPDYFADLDALLEAVFPGLSVDLVGHSMGGNIALLYAGLRPERVRRVVSLEGFGLRHAAADLAPARYRDWLRQQRAPIAATVFASVDALAARLRQRNPRLPEDRAAFVARAWTETLDDGRARLRFDPAHKKVNPILYRRDEAEACWREVRAPLLYVAGSESDFAQQLAAGIGDPETMRRFIPQLQACVIDGAGHMLHHEQPQALARAIDAFLGAQTL